MKIYGYEFGVRFRVETDEGIFEKTLNKKDLVWDKKINLIMRVTDISFDYGIWLGVIDCPSDEDEFYKEYIAEQLYERNLVKLEDMTYEEIQEAKESIEVYGEDREKRYREILEEHEPEHELIRWSIEKKMRDKLELEIKSEHEVEEVLNDVYTAKVQEALNRGVDIEVASSIAKDWVDKIVYVVKDGEIIKEF